MHICILLHTQRKTSFVHISLKRGLPNRLQVMWPLGRIIIWKVFVFFFLNCWSWYLEGDNFHLLIYLCLLGESSGTSTHAEKNSRSVIIWSKVRPLLCWLCVISDRWCQTKLSDEVEKVRGEGAINFQLRNVTDFNQLLSFDYQAAFDFELQWRAHGLGSDRQSFSLP